MKTKINRYCHMNFYVELYDWPIHQVEWLKGVLNTTIKGICADSSSVSSCGNTSYSTLRWYSTRLPANDIRRLSFAIWGVLVNYKIDEDRFRIEIIMGNWPSVDDDKIPF